jgi:hypothetical protein
MNMAKPALKYQHLTINTMRSDTILCTTMGDIRLKPIKGTVHSVAGGLWPSGNIDVIHYTSPDEMSGVMVTYNAKSGKPVKYARIQRSYISYESTLKFGRRCVTDTLPFYK